MEDLEVHGIKNYGTKNEPLFKSNEIGKLLGLKNIRSSIRNYSDDLKILKKCSTSGGQQTCIFLTMTGLNTVLTSSMKYSSIDLSSKLGMNLNFKNVRGEEEFGSLLNKIFKNETIIDQFYIEKYQYRLDFYFPDFKLAIEYDEPFHINQVAKDIVRMNKVTESLQCTFIRHSEKYDDIYETFGKIYEYITKYNL